MLHQSIFRNYSISRRQFLLGSIKGGLLALLMARLGYLQLFRHQQYDLLSKQNSISTLFIPPLRGEIFDRNGKKIAANQQKFRLIVHRPLTKTSKLNARKAMNLLNICQISQQEALKNMRNNPAFATLVENLSWEQIVLIEQNIFDLENIMIDNYFTRHYPYEEFMSHPLGYTAAANSKELYNLEIKKVKSFQIGKTGVEKYYNTQLIGSFGARQVEVDAHSRIVREMDFKNSQNGTNTHLSLDCELQKQIYALLADLSASVVVNDIKNNQLLSLVSTPGFQTNLFSQKVSQEYWQELNSDKKLPLLNKVTQASYPPGSIFKLVVCLAGLKDGFDPNTKVLCKGGPFLKNHFHCWNKNGHGWLNMPQAIGLSCNYYMYTIAKLIGYKKIIYLAEELGFGQLTNIDLPCENAGHIPNIVESNLHNWQLASTLNLAIGQGEITATPLQLNKLISTIATKGRFAHYSLLKNSPPQYTAVNIAPTCFDAIHQGMWRSVNNFGTSQSAKSRVQIAGKTGTAQVQSKIHASQDFSTINTPWHKRNHALFVGFAPFDDPQYAVSVVVEHGGSGGRDAAPIAKKVFELLL